MTALFRPHLLGIDDAPFDKRRDAGVPIVGVMMEGGDVIEGVAVARFPVDPDDATRRLADWIVGLRFREALHGVLLGGTTIAGLGIVDGPALAERVSLPVLVVNRRRPDDANVVAALRAAGLEDRIPQLTPAAAARQVGGAWVVAAGIDDDGAARLLEACRGKSNVPEPLRVAHLIGAAIVNGQSRGRV